MGTLIEVDFRSQTDLQHEVEGERGYLATTAEYQMDIRGFIIEELLEASRFSFSFIKCYGAVVLILFLPLLVGFWQIGSNGIAMSLCVWMLILNNSAYHTSPKKTSENRRQTSR